jgi:membrane-associated PAP2 superfamily phosphatase
MQLPASVKWMLLFFIGGGLLFHFLPSIDLAISGYFYHGDTNQFAPDYFRLYFGIKKLVYRINDVLIPLLAIALIIGFMPERYVAVWMRPIRTRRHAFLLAALVLGLVAGGLVSLAKEYYPRTRPVDVVQLGGDEPFVVAGNRAIQEGKSSLSGHAATGFSYVALAYLSRRHRRLYYVLGLAAGSIISFSRVAMGAHFFSDVYFSALLALMAIHWLVAYLGLQKNTAKKT